MLVIDHVVLQLVYHLAEIVNFERENTVRTQRFSDRSRRALNIGDVGINVVGHDQVDLAEFGDDAPGNFFGEVIIDNLDAGIVDCGDDVRRRIDADHGPDALIGQRTQQHAVVAAEFQHGSFRRIEKPLRDLGGIFPEMIAQCADRRREIKVVLKHDVGRDLVGYLYRVAVPAKMQPHRERSFGRELLGLQECAGEANLAKIHHKAQSPAVTERADRPS